MKKNITLSIIFYSILLGNDTSKVVETHNNGNISLISHYKDTENGITLIKQETFHYSGPKSMIGNFDNGLLNSIQQYEGFAGTGPVTDALRQSLLFEGDELENTELGLKTTLSIFILCSIASLDIPIFSNLLKLFNGGGGGGGGMPLPFPLPF